MKSKISITLKGILFFSLFVLIIFSSKNQQKNTKETIPIIIEEKSPFFNIPLVQLSVQKLIKDGKMDPFDFVQVLKKTKIDTIIERFKQEGEKVLLQQKNYC